MNQVTQMNLMVLLKHTSPPHACQGLPTSCLPHLSLLHQQDIRLLHQ